MQNIPNTSSNSIWHNTIKITKNICQKSSNPNQNWHKVWLTRDLHLSNGSVFFFSAGGISLTYSPSNPLGNAKQPKFLSLSHLKICLQTHSKKKLHIFGRGNCKSDLNPPRTEWLAWFIAITAETLCWKIHGERGSKMYLLVFLIQRPATDWDL